MAHSLSFSLISSFLRPFPTLTSELPANFRSFFSVNPSFSREKITLKSAAFSSVQSCRLSTSALMASGTTPPGVLTKGDSELLVFDNEEELSNSLAKYTADLSKKFCLEKGAFTVVLSGGSLVKSLRKLVETPYGDSIDWGKWHIFWVDERVVPKDHPDSNYKLVFDGFLSKVQIPAGQVYAINDSLSAAGAADDYESCLKHLVNEGVLLLSPATGFPKFDLMLLGMGPDGHIASLFPGHILLTENERWVTFINNSPKPPPERITFTFPVINSSAYVALVATGAGKADVVHQAFGSKNSSSVLLPVQMVKLDNGILTWFADKAAASKL
ncbi:probable 6-phosphogluconolactonase 4, chloroplastic [Dendrobium catenatum]|nr:probable 6-phosphogluconolactonase 4, chloroplastic [Dendrobium catenatum]XP_020677751.1 probable 6-phosphogluconolactonase 4, chloroplastic [Dendrobium catenatum]